VVTLKLTGSDAPLRGMLSALAAFGQGKVVRELAKKLAPELQALGDRPWQRRADPDGAPWVPRKGRYLHPMLEKTGRTRRSLRARASGTSVVTSVSTPYARFHQTGTRKMAARPIFPTRNELPPVWAARVRKTITDHLKGAIRG
jgi:phage gpG-like protein